MSPSNLFSWMCNFAAVILKFNLVFSTVELYGHIMLCRNATWIEVTNVTFTVYIYEPLTADINLASFF